MPRTRCWIAVLWAMLGLGCAPTPTPTLTPTPPPTPTPTPTPAWRDLAAQLPGRYRAGDIVVDYRLVSRDTALVETFRVGDVETLTVLHPDGTDVLLEHYCAQGNQARLRLASADAGGLRFVELDATNVGTSSVMVELVIAWTPDGFDQTSVYRAPDGAHERDTLHFVRQPVEPSPGSSPPSPSSAAGAPSSGAST